jgi:hypothetical protein
MVEGDQGCRCPRVFGCVPFHGTKRLIVWESIRGSEENYPLVVTFWESGCLHALAVPEEASHTAESPPYRPGNLTLRRATVYEAHPDEAVERGRRPRPARIRAADRIDRSCCCSVDQSSRQFHCIGVHQRQRMLEQCRKQLHVGRPGFPRSRSRKAGVPREQPLKGQQETQLPGDNAKKQDQCGLRLTAQVNVVPLRIGLRQPVIKPVDPFSDRRRRHESQRRTGDH